MGCEFLCLEWFQFYQIDLFWYTILIQKLYERDNVNDCEGL